VIRMDLVGLEGTAASGAGEDEVPPQLDGEGPVTTQEETRVLDGDPLTELGIEAHAEAGPSENGAASPEVDEPLDPGLVRLFLEANAEAEASLTASELPDIPIQDLLNELVSLSRSLGIERPYHTQPATGQDSAKPKRTPHSEAVRLLLASFWSHALPGLLLKARALLAGSQRHALRDLFVRVRLPLAGIILTLTLIMAIASVLIGVDHMISSEENQSQQPSAVATTPSGVVVKQVHPDGSVLEPTPAPTATRQPAYFMYTVQRGDTLIGIAAAFGLNLDHMLWANPEHIDDPDLLHVGDRLLIPNLAGMIYYVKPGDILSAIGRLLPAQEPDDPGPPPEQSQSPQ
jgi:LysM repeat protein